MRNAWTSGKIIAITAKNVQKWDCGCSKSVTLIVSRPVSHCLRGPMSTWHAPIGWVTRECELGRWSVRLLSLSFCDPAFQDLAFYNPKTVGFIELIKYSVF